MSKISANSIGLEAGAAGALVTGREKRDNVFEGMPLALSRCGAVSKPAGAMPSALFAIAASPPNPSARCSKLSNSIRMPPAFHAEAVWATGVAIMEGCQGRVLISDLRKTSELENKELVDL